MGDSSSAAGMDWRLKMEFVVPTESTLSLARSLSDSPDVDCRAVAKAILDSNTEATIVREGIANNLDVDLAPYLDFWFADALECANRLRRHPDSEIRNMANCLIELEADAIKSKECVLTEIKRLGSKPKPE